MEKKNSRIYDVYDIVKKLIGPITPVGETNTDSQRLKSLNETINLVDQLLFDISSVEHNTDRVEASMKAIGKKATEFLEELRESTAP